ncbi:MAG: hypothetical protein K0R54_1857 [Clostridiaceae bacterium]|jgi:hypothetical protein|nr:hypothetical protein [Clostridiaceae bacterium]
MLYHFSVRKVKKFYPRIPKCRIEGEDKTIKRICFSTNINRALTTMPSGVLKAKNLIQFEKSLNFPSIIYLYSLDENSISKENLINSASLVRRNLVPDALMGKEVWVINQDAICKEEIIRITNMDIILKKYKCFGYRSKYVVKNIEYEHSIEPFERTYVYELLNDKECKSVGRLAKKAGCIIKYDNLNEITIIAPPNVNIGKVWEKVSNLKWSVLRSYLKDKSSNERATSVDIILSTCYKKVS